MAALIAAMIVVGALALALWPVLVASEPSHFEPRPIESLEAERGRLIAAIRDADLDLAMGKISTVDHADMRRSLEADALRVLALIEQEHAPHAAPGKDGADSGEPGA